MSEVYPDLAPMFRGDVPENGKQRPDVVCRTCPALDVCRETVREPLAWVLCEAPTDDDEQKWKRQGLFRDVLRIRLEWQKYEESYANHTT